MISAIPIDQKTKGSRKNKFTFLGVEAPVWQGAKAQEHRDISSFRNPTYPLNSVEPEMLFSSPPFGGEAG
jgi:hypothetical protein